MTQRKVPQLNQTVIKKIYNYMASECKLVGIIPTILPIKTNMNNENTKGKYFLPLSPTVSDSNCAIKLYINSDISCILDGMIDFVLTVSVKNKVTIKTVNSIANDEFVNDKLYPAISIFEIGSISNCLSGLSLAAIIIYEYLNYFCFSMRRITRKTFKNPANAPNIKKIISPNGLVLK